MASMTIWSEVARVARARGPHPAIRFEGESLSYDDLARRVQDRASLFDSAGIGLGDRVCLFLPNIPEFAVSYYALMRLGAIAVSVNVMCKADEIRHIVNDAGAVALVTTRELEGSLPSRDSVVCLKSVLIDLFDAGPIDGHEAPPTLDLPRESPAAILYTSGTTGVPKGAVLSHGNVVSNAHSARHASGMGKDDVTLCFLPLFHCFGQNYLLNASLFSGATVALERRFSVDAVLACLARERVTMFFAVPTAYIALLADERLKESLSRSRLRYAFSAAAILPVHVEARRALPVDGGDPAERERRCDERRPGGHRLDDFVLHPGPRPHRHDADAGRPQMRAYVRNEPGHRYPRVPRG